MHEQAFPKWPLFSAGALIVSSLLLVLGVRTTGEGAVRTPQTAVVAERLLHFVDRSDGSIDVLDARDARVIEAVAPGTNGFLRGTLRGLARERKREGIGAEIAFRLTGHSDGRLLLEDPATRRLVDLGSFGPTNAAVFARMLTDNSSMAPQNSQTPPLASTAMPH